MKRWRDRFPDKTFLQVRGLDLHYERRGKGPPVLLVHGLADSTLTWRGAAKILAHKGFDVVSIDLRGSGYSERAADADLSTDTLVDELATVIDLLELERPVVAGVSYGGLLALLLAVRHPGRVGGLIVCNAIAYAEPMNLPLDLKLPRHPLLNAVGHWVMSRRALEKTFRVWNFNENWKGVVARVDEHWRQINLPGGKRAFMGLVKGVDEAVIERASRLYPLIRVPTLLLWGEREKWFPKEQGEKLAQAIPGSRLMIVKGAMHLFMEENPHAFTARALPFLKRVLKKKRARPKTKAKAKPKPKPKRRAARRASR